MRLARLLATTALLLLLGCGAAEDKTGKATDATRICAVLGPAGGLLELSGKITLQLPADALGTDLELCLEELTASQQPDADKLGSAAFLVSPENLFLANPGTLSIKVAKTPPDGTSPRVAVLEEGTWKDKAGPQNQPGWVSTDVISLGTYAAFFADTQSVEVPYDKEVALGLTWSFWEEDEGDGPLPIACTSDEQCQPGEVCKSTQCIPPTTPDDYAPSDVQGYVGCITPPDDSSCCFDITGDGEVDNRLIEIMEEWVELAPNGEMDVSLGYGFLVGLQIDGTTYISDFRTLPDDGSGAVEFWLLAGDNDLDFDGKVDQPHSIRLSGQGLFQLDPKGFDGHGAQSQFNRAAIKDGLLQAEGGDFWFGYTMPDGRVIVVPAHGVRAEGEVQFDEHGAHIDQLRIGGYASFAEALAQWDGIARTCSCAGIDPEQPVFAYDVKKGIFEAWCNQWPKDATKMCDLENEYLCHSLPLLCLVAPIIGSQNDVNSGWKGTDGSTGNDAMSFGLLLKVVPATLTDPPFMPDLVAVDDHMGVKSNGLPVHLHVLGNDTDVTNPVPQVLSVSAPQHGTAAISPDGGAVVYQAEEGFVGLDSFTYTLGSSAEAVEATAHLYVGVEVALAPVPDTVDVQINRGPQALDLLANDNFDPSMVEMIWLDLYNSAGLEGGHLGTTANRRKALFVPRTTLDGPTQGQFTYAIHAAQNFHRGGDATVTINFVQPETVCGDGFVDEWIEACDDFNATPGDGCDESCQLETCPEGGDPAPRYLDGDSDGFGLAGDVVYACEPIDGRVSQPGDCDDGNPEIPGDEGPLYGQTCKDGLDNDCDGWADCGEFACGDDSPLCNESDCSDGLDSDGDGAIDCSDPDCEFASICEQEACEL